MSGTLPRPSQHRLPLPPPLCRQLNFVIRLQARLAGLCFLFFVLCLVIYTFVGFNSCRSYMLSWLGFLPVLQVSE